MNPDIGERLKNIREKIESMKNIDPNTFITKEELEQLRRNHKIPERGILHSGPIQGRQAQNAAPQGSEDLRQPFPVKKIFAFDTLLYRDFHSKYEKDELKAPNAQKTENNVEQVPIVKENAVVGEIEKKATIQINPPAESSSLIKLVPVNQGEVAVEKEKAEESKPQEAPILPPKDIVATSNQQTTKVQSVNIFQKPATGEPTPFNIFEKKPSAENSSNNAQPTSLFGNKTTGINIFSLNKPKVQEKGFQPMDTNLINIEPPKTFASKIPQKKGCQTDPVPTFIKPQFPKTNTQTSLFSRQNTGGLNFNSAKLEPIENKPQFVDFNKKNEENKPTITPLFPPPQTNSNNTSFFDINKSVTPQAPVIKQESKPAPVPLFGPSKSFFPQPQEPTKNIPTFLSNTSFFGNQAVENKSSPSSFFSQPAQQTPPPQPEQPQASKEPVSSNNIQPLSLFNNAATNSQPPKKVSLFEGNQGPKPTVLFNNKPQIKQPQIKPVMKPLFGSAESKMDKSSLFNNQVSSMPEKPKIIFPDITQESNQSLFNKRSATQPVFNSNSPVKSQPFETSLFETKPNFNFVMNVQSSSPAQKVSPPVTGLFANQTQNSPVQAPKPETVINTLPEASQENQRNKSEKDEKKVNTTTAIGPGGKTIELLTASIFKSDKPITPSGADLFKAPTNNIFGSSERPSTLFANLGAPNESKPIGNIFAQNSTNSLFSQSTGSLFGNSNPLFGSQAAPKTNSLFGNRQFSIFNSQNNQNRVVQGEQQGQGEEEDDDAPIQAEDDANPNLSTGKYDYIQTKNFFKQQANKFREGQKETMDNVTISIEQFQNSQDKFLYVRMPNKCIAFCGKFLKNITEVRVINNSKKNVEVKKILLCGENAGKVELAVVRIGFKDDSIGEKFLKEVEVAIEKQK